MPELIAILVVVTALLSPGLLVAELALANDEPRHVRNADRALIALYFAALTHLFAAPATEALVEAI